MANNLNIEVNMFEFKFKPLTREDKRRFDREAEKLGLNIVAFETMFSENLFNSNFEYNDLYTQTLSMYKEWVESCSFRDYKFIKPNPMFFAERYKPVEKWQIR